MNIVKATRKYEGWLAQQLQIVDGDLQLKHERMAASAFSFFRATFYRWLQLWEEVCAHLHKVPGILSVGDLHVENFGTWRDSDGRLVWGVNDFDETCIYPYTMDLVRLATSALLAAREKQLTMTPKSSAQAIVAGYQKGMEQGGRPFVLEEEHSWLRAIAESKLRDPVVFWQKMDRLPVVRGEIPESAREALEHLMPEPGLEYRLAHRVAGMGSLGRVRIVAIANWKGAQIAREAKALAPSASHWVDPRAPREILYGAILKRAVRCPDPYVQLRGHWIVRRLSPHCSRIELEALGTARGELRLLEAMGHETANIHAGNEEKRLAIVKDLGKHKTNWLVKAAEAMAEKVEKDWRAWKERWQNRAFVGKQL
jgi:Uncharacterized protein conserved in bacteria (DUF2252)